MIQTCTDLPARTIGIDLGDSESACCTLDDRGRIVAEGTIGSNKESLIDRFGEEPSSRIVIEACGHSPWIAPLLRKLGHEVIVANPRQVHLISKSDRKTDRNDARILARLGRVDPALLRPVSTRGEKSMAVRALLSARSQLVGIRTRLVNMVRAETKAFGGRVPRCSAASFHRTAGRHIPPPLRPALEPLLAVLGDFHGRIHAYDQEIARLGAEEFPETRVLRQVRGVGPIVALTFIVTIEDPKRFRSSRSVGAYAGLTPRCYQSGARNPQLRISKRGDASLRKMLVTAATHIMRVSSPDTDLKRYGKRLARRGSQRDRARARIAVARKLVVLLHRLWLTAEVYEPLHAHSPAA